MSGRLLQYFSVKVGYQYNKDFHGCSHQLQIAVESLVLGVGRADKSSEKFRSPSWACTNLVLQYYRSSILLSEFWKCIFSIEHILVLIIGVHATQSKRLGACLEVPN